MATLSCGAQGRRRLLALDCAMHMMASMRRFKRDVAVQRHGLCAIANLVCQGLWAWQLRYVLCA